MSTDTVEHKHIDSHSHDDSMKADWTGGKTPFKASYGKLMMWYFLVSDAFTFAGFLIAYGATRFSMPSWPVPDFVFSSLPGDIHHKPLIFVTIMTFVLLFSSFTMVRGVQEGKRENKKGIIFWMALTIIGGLGFLGCQAWEWTTLITKEHMTITTNPFGTYTESGKYLDAEGKPSDEIVKEGHSYIMHKIDVGHGEGHATAGDHGTGEHVTDGEHADHGASYAAPGDYPDAVVDERGFIHKKYITDSGEIKAQEFGPKAFGALFFFITGFHGFHVFSGVLFLLIILVNVATGLYVKRKNGYEMVEKIGLYWHFVDLVWVFVFLVFYLL